MALLEAFLGGGAILRDVILRGIQYYFSNYLAKYSTPQKQIHNEKMHESINFCMLARDT